MADYLGNPKVQYFESGTGDFLAGGKLYTYEAGTLIALASYPTPTDAANATNVNANPIILDARGEADVVLTEATKLVLKDANDNTIWTVDNVSSNITAANLEDSNGNTILSFVTVLNSVNYWQITNAAAGTGPILESVGSDTNIPATLSSKGSGTLLLDGGLTGDVDINTTSTGDINLRRDTNVTGTLTTTGAVTIGTDLTVDGNTTHTGTTTLTGATTANGDIDLVASNLQLDSKDVLIASSASTEGEIRLYEDTDNGTNYIALKAPTSLTGDVTLTLPNGDGTVGQGVVTDGSGTLSWKNLTGWDLLETITCSASSTVDFTSGITSSHDTYKIVFSKVIFSTTTADLYLRTSTDNGSSFRSGASDYYHNNTSFGSATTYNAASTTAMVLSQSTHTGPVSGDIKIYGPEVGTTGTSVVGTLMFLSSTTLTSVFCSGQDRVVSDVDAIRLLPSTGNFTSGTISLYGIKI